MIKNLSDIIAERSALGSRIANGVSGDERITVLNRNSLLKSMESHIKQLSKLSHQELVVEYDRATDKLNAISFDVFNEGVNVAIATILKELDAIKHETNNMNEEYSCALMELAVIGGVLNDNTSSQKTTKALEDELTETKRELREHVNLKVARENEIMKKDAVINTLEAEITKLKKRISDMENDKSVELEKIKLEKEQLTLTRLEKLAEITKDKKAIKADIAAQKEKDRELKLLALEEKKKRREADELKKKEQAAIEEAAKKKNAGKPKPDEDLIALYKFNFNGIREAKRQLINDGYDVSDL